MCTTPICTTNNSQTSSLDVPTLDASAAVRCLPEQLRALPHLLLVHLLLHAAGEGQVKILGLGRKAAATSPTAALLLVPAAQEVCMAQRKQ